MAPVSVRLLAGRCQNKGIRYNVPIMQKYDGLLVHRTQDELGPIEVVEDSLHRSLHFGTEPKQSSMRLDEPLTLVLSYTRAMTAALLFVPEVRRVLLIGLGGGSLAKFLLNHYPDARLDVVEFRPAVHRVARDWFALPDEPRLSLHFGDGGEFICEADREQYQDYDLILVDAFEAMGIADSVCSSRFFDACRERLGEKGMLAINLWSRDRFSLDQILHYLADSFAGELLRLPVGGKENVIALAGRLPGVKRRLKQLGARAESLERTMHVEYPLLLRTLRKSNRSFFF